jgi:hypothetical protein
MHLSLDGFVAAPNGEMNRIKVDEEIFDHVGKRISEGDAALYGRATYFHAKPLRSKDAKIFFASSFLLFVPLREQKKMN